MSMKINKVIILPHVFQDMDPKFTAKCDPALGFCTIGYDTPFMFECCFNLPLPLPPASASLMTLLLKKKKKRWSSSSFFYLPKLPNKACSSVCFLHILKLPKK